MCHNRLGCKMRRSRTTFCLVSKKTSAIITRHWKHVLLRATLNFCLPLTAQKSAKRFTPPPTYFPSQAPYASILMLNLTFCRVSTCLADRSSASVLRERCTLKRTRTCSTTHSVRWTRMWENTFSSMSSAQTESSVEKLESCQKYYPYSRKML